jgi:hypothetical protein
MYIRVLTMPNHGVPLHTARHFDGTEITLRERVFACSKAIDAIADLYIHAVPEQPEEFPEMHHDVSYDNIMINSPGTSDPDNAVSLIDFDYATSCNINKKYLSSGAPHLIGTRASTAMPFVLADGSKPDPYPHPRPYFDIEKVFWSLYVTALFLKSGYWMRYQFCGRNQGREKYSALKIWNSGESRGEKDVQVVWKLLGGMRRYLFLMSKKPLPEAERTVETETVQILFPQPWFDADGVGGKKPVGPWWDSSEVVKNVRKELQVMFEEALNELEALEVAASN